MRVMVVAPHPDDESMGCGGTIVAHRAAGDHVTIVWLTSGEGGLSDVPGAEARGVREAEALRAAAVLDASDHTFFRCPDRSLEVEQQSIGVRLARLLNRDGTQMVYAPHPEDGHADHAAAHCIASRALDLVGLDVAICGYEVWTPLTHVDFVWPIDEHVERKLEAIRCHRSQLDHFQLDAAAEGLAAYRGALFGGCRYAEAFACVERRVAKP